MDEAGAGHDRMSDHNHTVGCRSGGENRRKSGCEADLSRRSLAVGLSAIPQARDRRGLGTARESPWQARPR
jgi:hypothetical protein